LDRGVYKFRDLAKAPAESAWRARLAYHRAPMPETAATLHARPAQAADLLLRWPRGEPLAALVSGGDDRAHNAWSIFARPTEAVVIDGALPPAEALAQLDEALARTPRRTHACTPTGARTPPFDGGWVIALGYDLGECFEERSFAAKRANPAPHAVLLWCDSAWCVDHSDGSLHAVGTPPELDAGARGSPWSLSRLDPDTSDSHYAASVARVVEYIRAGDAFQANVARRFSGEMTGETRTFAHAAISRNRAWFGASLDLPNGERLVSMSPELFLRARPDGSVVTRPIKGTRPAHIDARELEESSKDAAELAMIVDLMRNDLGRVAEIGSVRVNTARVLETHTTVHHGVAEISAQLRDDVSWLDLLRATFPPGSVTGAPKIRAMQIIDELEPHSRGFYCGAIGFISRSGHAALNVAIRTAQIGVARDERGSRPVHYHAGCGIVADSDPASEVAETYAKARAIARFLA
jgi:anthranilate/para-aminobenzoate synthase component I